MKDLPSLVICIGQLSLPCHVTICRTICQMLKDSFYDVMIRAALATSAQQCQVVAYHGKLQTDIFLFLLSVSLTLLCLGDIALNIILHW